MATKDITDLQVCMAVRAASFVRTARLGWRGGPPHVHQVLHSMTGQAPKVCWSALERAYGRRLIECGIGLQGAWLEPAGRDLLANTAKVQDMWSTNYRVGDFVTREGDDVHMATALFGGNSGEFLCLKAPAKGWIEQGEIESNMARRYTRVELGEIFGSAHPDELLEARNPQHVLKAEGASPDATDRGNCATASPGGGPMGAGQAAAAAPVDGEASRNG